MIEEVQNHFQNSVSIFCIEWAIQDNQNKSLYLNIIIFQRMESQQQQKKIKKKYVKKQQVPKEKQKQVQSKKEQITLGQNQLRHKQVQREQQTRSKIVQKTEKIQSIEYKPPKQKYKLKQTQLKQNEHLVSDKLDDVDMRQLKKSLIQITNKDTRSQHKTQDISIIYRQDKPELLFFYTYAGRRNSIDLRDLIQANSKFKKKKQLIRRVFDALYRKVQNQFYSIGLFGIIIAEKRRVNFIDKGFKQMLKSKINNEYLLYFTIMEQSFNFILFDSALNSIQFNTKDIEKLRDTMQKQFALYRKFQAKKLKDLRGQQNFNQTFGQEQLDSDQQSRTSRIANQKQQQLKDIKAKLLKILDKDLSDIQQRIQQNNAKVQKAAREGQQNQLVQKLAEEVMQQQSSLDNFNDIKNDINLKINMKFSSEKQEIKVVKNCLKRIIIAQKQLEARLPIISRKRQIFQRLNKSNLLILEGETGSGKSTQLPQILCQYYNIFQNQKSLPVLITQPRKLATRTLAERVANQMQQKIHGFVDYQTTLTTKVNQNAKIIFKMDRLVLDQLKLDPKLSKYCCLVIDEAHQRTISIDVILGLIRNLLKLRSDFKVIVTSASMDTELFKRYYKTQILKVSGRMFPVQQRFFPYPNEKNTTEKIKKVINQQLLNDNQQNLKSEFRGHVLVFCSGVDQITQLQQYYSNKLNRRVFQVHALHGKLTPQEQREVFSDSQQYKLIFASRIAETSITINRVKVVIDPGQDRQMVYDQKNKVTSMKLKKISQSSAKQRAGRAGRTNQGFCFRLYSDKQKKQLQLNKVPEMQNMALDSVVLRLKSLWIQDIINFPYLSPPSKEGLLSSIQLMKMIDCLDQKTEKITVIGDFLVKIPIEPFLARALVQAMIIQNIMKTNDRNLQNVLKMKKEQVKQLFKLQLIRQVISILSLVVSASNLFYTRNQNRQQVDQKKFNKLKDQDGDFFFLLNIYRKYIEFIKSRQINMLKKWTREHFISQKVLSQTRDLQKQITQIIQQFPIDKQFFNQKYYTQSRDKLIQAKSVREVIMSCLISSFASNLALCSYSSRNSEIIGYTIINNQLPVHIYGTSILCLQGICPKWIFYYDLFQNEKGQMYCKIANSVDFDFLIKNANAYIIRKFKIKDANAINPYYGRIEKKLPTLVFSDILSDYQRRHYDNNNALNFLQKFHINFDQQNNKIQFYYKKQQKKQQNSYFMSLLKQKMNQFLNTSKYRQSQNMQQIIMGYTKQTQSKFIKNFNYNYVGHIYTLLGDGFDLKKIEMKYINHIYRVYATDQFAQWIAIYCGVFGTCQRFDSVLVFKISMEENRLHFQKTLLTLTDSFKTNYAKIIKWQHEIEDTRKKIPQVKLYLRFWASQVKSKNLYLTFDRGVPLQHIIQDIKIAKSNLNRGNLLTGLDFKITKTGNGINCFCKTQIDEVQLYEILQKYNRQKILPVTFRMPKYIKRFRQPDFKLSVMSDQDWKKQIKAILIKQNIRQQNIALKVWGRYHYNDKRNKNQNIGEFQKSMRVQMFAEIRGFDLKMLQKFKQKYNKKQNVLGSQKVHINFQFEQIAAVTSKKAFQSLKQQYQSIIEIVHERYPLITFEQFERNFRKLTKVYIKIRSVNRDQLIWPLMLISKLFTSRLIPLPEIKFRFLDRMNEGNKILEDIQSLYNFGIYFSFQRKSLSLKVYCRDNQIQDIQKLLHEKLDQHTLFSQEISYRGKNLNKVKQICDRTKQHLEKLDDYGKFFEYQILFRFRKIKITGDIKTCDQVKNQIMSLINKSKQQCTICSDLFQKQYRLFNCRHQFCQLCLTSYIRQSINSTSSQLLKCPQSCNKLISVYDVHKVMTEEQFSRFCDIRISRYIEKSKQYHICLSPNCENIFMCSQSLRDGCFDCDLCGKWYCYKCKQPHKGYTCQDWKFKFDQTQLQKLGIKKCPNCQEGIQKNQGCQHVTCIKCKKHICWNCLKFFDDSKSCYDHLAKQCGGIYANQQQQQQGN